MTCAFDPLFLMKVMEPAGAPSVVATVGNAPDPVIAKLVTLVPEEALVNKSAPAAASVTVLASVPETATGLAPVGITVTAVPEEGLILKPLNAPEKVPLTGAVPAT